VPVFEYALRSSNPHSKLFLENELANDGLLSWPAANRFSHEIF